MSTIKKTIYKSFLSDIDKDMRKAERRVLVQAAKHVQKRIRLKIGKRGAPVPGQPPKRVGGNLRRGIRFNFANKDTVKVGAGAPAQHAHLLEFGTTDRVRKDGKNTGKVTKSPFIIPTIIEETPKVKEILSQKWI